MNRGLKRAFVRAREAADDWALAARADLFPAQSYDVQRFESAEDIAKFQITTDKVLGPQGQSQCQFTLRDYAHFSSGLFMGTIDYRDENPQSRGGFAAFRTRADERIRDLSSFEALELRIKTDGRPYTLNLKAAHSSPDFLWQIRLQTDPLKWMTVAFPFRDMVLTRRGRVEMTQHAVERDNVQGWGVLLADGSNGPFKFEMQYLRALREFNASEYEGVAAQQISDAARERAALQAQAAATQKEHGPSLDQLRDFYREQREVAKLK